MPPHRPDRARRRSHRQVHHSFPTDRPTTAGPGELRLAAVTQRAGIDRREFRPHDHDYFRDLFGTFGLTADQEGLTAGRVWRCDSDTAGGGVVAPTAGLRCAGLLGELSVDQADVLRAGGGVTAFEEFVQQGDDWAPAMPGEHGAPEEQDEFSAWSKDPVRLVDG